MAVFEHQGKRKMKFTAYTVWYNPSWEGCCMHNINEISGKIAKAAAIEEHIRVCRNGDEIGNPL